MADLQLEDLRIETFTPLVGTEFELAAGDQKLPFELVETRGPATTPPGFSRPPFVLTFQAAGPRPLPQAIYRLEHPALGGLEIFLVPVARCDGGFRYEAVFT